MWKKFLLLCFFTLTVKHVEGLRCFSCTATYADGVENPDLTCVNSPNDVPGKSIITCPSRMKFCTIVRNDYKGSGSVSSIERNCAENPVIMNEDIEGDELITHYRTCQTELCNKGTGIESSNDNDGGNNNGGMIVPGRSAGHSLTFVWSLLSTALFILLKFSY